MFVAALFKNFFHYPFWKKAGLSVTIFFGSHWSGMYTLKRDSELMCDKYIDKYKQEFINSKFICSENPFGPDREIV